MSHTPVFGKVHPPAAVEAEVRTAIAASRADIDAFQPELIVLFAPDHFMGFFHNVMPAFCIGAAATSVGDYGTSAGNLDVPTSLAVECTQTVLEQNVDVALSHAMQVDHGFAQPLDLLCGGIARYPVLPIFINAIGAPVAPLRRSRELGTAVGLFLRSRPPDMRIVIMGSGGLSHDPPVPMLDTAPPPIRARLIAGGSRSHAHQAEHEARVCAAAEAFAKADPIHGGGALLPLNPAWDQSILRWLNEHDFASLEALSNDAVSAAGGCSGHEIRCWIAAYACLHAFGEYRAVTRYYRAIPEWIAGFAIAHATLA